MKIKSISFILSLFAATAAIAASFCFISPAQAASQIALTEISHRNLAGQFIDDQLATELAPTGKWGKIVLGGASRIQFWMIDPSFIDDVIAMSGKYQLADNHAGANSQSAIDFLAALKSDLTGKVVQAIPYGNPSEYWVSRITPHDLDYYLSLSAVRLGSQLGMSVLTPTNYFSNHYVYFNSAQFKTVRAASNTIQLYAGLLDSSALEDAKLALTHVMNPGLTGNQRNSAADDLTTYTNSLSHKLRLSTGRYTVTSSKQSLPITIINDFAKPAHVRVNLATTNERAVVNDINSVTIPAKSKIQVFVNLKVLVSGSSVMIAQLQNTNGVALSELVEYPLTLAVISPIATWITSAAAILLFAAAVFSSIKRLRKGRAANE
jgi:hypothetical protein